MVASVIRVEVMGAPALCAIADRYRRARPPVHTPTAAGQHSIAARACRRLPHEATLPRIFANV
jgi:hypothetical protein